MSKIILFSPIGGTDPIDQINYHDGSMLHICRWRKVDEVYLYLSAEMLELEEKDHRFTRSIEKIALKQQREIKTHLIENDKLVDPHKFDQFYEDFSTRVKEISQHMEPGDTLLFNVSSGTPAMKNAPLVLASLGEISCECVQVATPTKRMGDHVHEKIFDLDLLWELDPDNEENAKDRTENVVCPSLVFIRDKQRIINLVKNHEYYFAYLLAQDLPAKLSADFIKYLEFAKERSLFNLHKAVVLEKELKINCLPVRNDDYIKIFEYALICDLKVKRHELADFLRSITPLLQELFIKVIKKQIGLNMNPKNDNAWIKFDKHNRLVWNKENIIKYRKDSEKLEKFICLPLEKLGKDHKPSYDFDFGAMVANDHLATVIKAFCEDRSEDKQTSKLYEISKTLRKIVEEKLRNYVAHQIVEISDALIEKTTSGISAVDIMNMLKKLFEYTDVGFNSQQADDYWQSYEKMNSLIIDRINGVTNAGTN